MSRNLFRGCSYTGNPLRGYASSRNLFRGCAYLFAHLLTAIALAFGLTFALTPAPAFAAEDGNAPTAVRAADEAATVADGSLRLTKLDDGTVLVELLGADQQSAVDVGLQARDAQGAALSGATFAFTPEAEALPTHHDVVNGAEVRLVVANGFSAISSDGGTFVLGTLSVPANTAKVSVSNFTQVDAAGSERTVTVPESDSLVLGNVVVNPGDDPAPGNTSNTNTNTNTAANTGVNTSTNTATNTATNTSNSNSNTQTGNRPNIIQETVRPTPTTGVRATGMKLAQTSDAKLLDASALLLIGGAAALLAAVIIAFRRHLTRSRS